ncbi:MAG: tRNA lysidine(34) synthetase TilS [Flavobacterium sp.]|nr:MAG: tRNA lysidine(34) synthetase TilS [Flavobacterium sp.]
MLDAFKKHLRSKLPFLQRKKLLLAVSGGVDSMVMAELFRQLGFEFEIAHCNFKLRGDESDGDQKFITDYAEKNNFVVHSTSFDTKKFASDNRLSIQVAARRLRYLWFTELLAQNKLDYILTAHHADDNLETFLINFSRGTGIEGLTGIPMVRGNIVRPLLVFSRKEIATYARKQKIKWREDSSNSEENYLRNKIRHKVVPSLKTLNVDFLRCFGETVSHLQQSETMVADAAALVYKQVAIDNDDKVFFKIPELKRLPNFQAYLYRWLSPYGFHAWDDIHSLIDAENGKKVLAPGFILLKDHEVLILSRPPQPVDKKEYSINRKTDPDRLPVALKVCDAPDIGEVANDCIFVDAKKLQFPLKLRTWHEQDYFYPFGMKGKKKTVSKFLRDEKVPVIEKQNTWLLLSDDEVVWVVGRRMDDRFRVSADTEKIINIKLA